MDPASDFELMDLIRKGDSQAFRTLVNRHQAPLLNFFRRLGAHTDAEDLAQETFLRVFKYRFRYRPDAKFTTFLFTLARHAWADGLRKGLKQERVAEGIRGEIASGPPEERPAAPDRLDAEAALAALPEKLRWVVTLGVFQGLRYEEIGRILGIPEGTVKSRMFLALERLRALFGVENGDRE